MVTKGDTSRNRSKIFDGADLGTMIWNVGGATDGADQRVGGRNRTIGTAN